MTICSVFQLSLIFCCVWRVVSATSLSACIKNEQKIILYLPLDERFTTRDAFLNLAKVTPYCVLTPDIELLPSLKEEAQLADIHAWVESHVKYADAMVLSAEMYLYGGLIASRISNESTSVIMNRADTLMRYRNSYPDLAIYVSNVVMRIPSYDGDFEEPWYWRDYGLDLYTFSFYMDKYSQLHEPNDLTTATEAVANVPNSAVEEFLWRRQRNHNITMYFLNAMDQGENKNESPFQFFYTTLDDSAEYGFNIREAMEIKSLIASFSEEDIIACPVYPGADEVHLTMLARFCSRNEGVEVELSAVFREPSTIYNIPAYEGQPMIDTLMEQTAAAGALLTLVNVNGDARNKRTKAASGLRSSVEFLNSRIPTAEEYFQGYLLVNNFSEENQREAADQPIVSTRHHYPFSSTSEYDVFIPFIKHGLARHTPLGFLDNRYANGGDGGFVSFMTEQLTASGSETLQNQAYAGWNTNGNTIGTVVANTIILTVFGRENTPKFMSKNNDVTFNVANAAFNSLRILEDMHYQADLRQVLISYVEDVTNTDESTSYLTPDLSFYERFIFKTLSARYVDIVTDYNLPWKLQSNCFPWNRTFEIGLSLQDIF